jgi:cytidylate kinase
MTTVLFATTFASARRTRQSPATRRARAAASAALCDRRASKAVAEDDAGRAAYLRDFYNVVDEDPTHYDLTLNSDTLSIELMAELVIRAASSP